MPGALGKRDWATAALTWPCLEASSVLAGRGRRRGFPAGLVGFPGIPRYLLGLQGIRVFDDLEPYRVKARFRYRITDGALKLGYHLNDPERVVRDAVGLVVAKAEAACGVKIMLGRPS